MNSAAEYYDHDGDDVGDGRGGGEDGGEDVERLGSEYMSIRTRLFQFWVRKRIPNIIFHGTSMQTKMDMLSYFVDLIYAGDKQQIKSNVLTVNCAHGKGIKFVREELKFFAKTNVQNSTLSVASAATTSHFKSIVLINADVLSLDAQSALRRCIELFSNTTRFFMVVENKNKLLKPILSRFCLIYLWKPPPPQEDERANTNKLLSAAVVAGGFHIGGRGGLLSDGFGVDGSFMSRFQSATTTGDGCHVRLMKLCTELYEDGFSSYDIVHFFLITTPAAAAATTTVTPTSEEDGCSGLEEEERKVDLLLVFEKVKKEFRSEKLLMLFMMNYLKTGLKRDKKRCLTRISYY